jgi:hypothetical protein
MNFERGPAFPWMRQHGGTEFWNWHSLIWAKTTANMFPGADLAIVNYPDQSSNAKHERTGRHK